MTKLTPEQRGLLLRRARMGASSRELAAEFGVSQTQAAKLVRENTPPDPKAMAAAKLQAIIDDESLPVAVRLQAADALKASLAPQAAPERPATLRPLHVPSASASSLDNVKNLFGDDAPKPKPAPTPKPAKSPAELRAEQIDRANRLMEQAVSTGNVQAIERLTTIFRDQGLYAPELSAPVTTSVQQKEAPATVDPNWIWRKTYQLEVAAVCGSTEEVMQLRQEFTQRGVPIPPHKGFTPLVETTPEPERPAIPFPSFDEAAQALQAKRTKPVGPRAMTYGEFMDSW